MKLVRLRSCFISICILLTGTGAQVNAQVAPQSYILWLTDKAHNAFNLDHPEGFLSQRAIERRQRQHISIDSTDLPVSAPYLDSLRDLNLKVKLESRWFNYVIVVTDNPAIVDSARKFTFVKKSKKSALPTPMQKSMPDKWTYENNFAYAVSSEASEYGLAYAQIHIHRGDSLHTLGYKGQGIQIAVLDAGFYKVDTLPAFDSLRSGGQILGTRDFVTNTTQVYEDHYHGMNVLSIMAGNVPGTYIGTAPGSSYWLLRTENANEEYIIEEDQWVEGAEFADSVGSDIIQSSLGYTVFNDALQNHTYADLDGHTTRISKGAMMAASKGMLVVVSAGNEGNDSWKYISAPADADSILSVGATNINGEIASFSSRGPSYDHRIKPDVVSVGSGTYMQHPSGAYIYSSGTSFSCPIIAGLAACLWQAVPELTAHELRQIILQSSSQFSHPDTIEGYGIPDFITALDLAQQLYPQKKDSGKITVYPNPFCSTANVILSYPPTGTIRIEVIDITGAIRLSMQYTVSDQPAVELKMPWLSRLPKGIYLLKVTTGNWSRIRRIIKI